MDDMPILTREDEEFQMLLDVTKEFPRQSGSIPQKSGKATQSVIRGHLRSHSLNVSQNRVSIEQSKKLHLLVLRKGINLEPNKKYSPNKVHTVLEIRNNAVGSPDRNPNVIIRNKFNEVEKVTKVNRFTVIVLSKRLTSPYPYVITTKDIGKDNCEVFTLVTRKKRAHKLYLRETVMKMLENHELRRTGEWEKLIDYLEG